MRKEFEIVNKLGLHARPAEFVRCVVRFKSTQSRFAKVRRISRPPVYWKLLTANLKRGDRIVLEAVGPDEQEALNEIAALLLRFRDEERGAHPPKRLLKYWSR